MQSDPEKKRKIIGGALIAVFLIGVIVILLTLPGKDSPDNSAETTSDNNTQAGGPAPTQYTGFAQLSQYGFTSYQMEGVRYALYQFNKNAVAVDIDPSTIKQADYDRNKVSEFITFRFDIKIDGTGYNVRADKYMDLTSIRLYLFKAGNQQAIYDSQLIDSTKLRSTTPSNDYGE